MGPELDPPMFHRLVENTDWAAVLNLVRSGIAWDALRTRSGLTALAAAVIDEASLMVGNLLDAGASPGPFALFDGQTFSPLWAAIDRGHEIIARRLLSAGADPNEESQGRFPILIAAQSGQGMTTRALCQAGARPDPDPRRSALHLWVPQMVEEHPQRGRRFGSPDPILALLDAGANADARDAQGRSVPQAARQTWAEFLGGRDSVLSAEATLIALERSLLRQAVGDVTGSRAHRRL